MQVRVFDDIEYFSLSIPFLVFSSLFMIVIAFLGEDCRLQREQVFCFILFL